MNLIFEFLSPYVSLQTTPTEPERTPVTSAANVSYCDPAESSCQSHTSSSSNPPEGRPGSSQTQISTSCTIDDFDTDSSISSVLEQGYLNGAQTVPPVYLKGDTYSIVGSLNSNTSALNGTNSSGVYSSGLPLLNMYRLQGKDSSTQRLPLPGGTHVNNRAPNPQPLRMEELLNVRLDQVTFDLSQPPYDSLQTYEFEGRDSRAESLSSLESDGEKDSAQAVGGLDELNQKFQKLVEIIRERQNERQAAEKETAETTPVETPEQSQHKEKEQQRWDF